MIALWYENLKKFISSKAQQILMCTIGCYAIDGHSYIVQYLFEFIAGCDNISEGYANVGGGNESSATSQN